VFLWEKIRPLTPLPAAYAERFANVQAAIGLEALRHVDRWTNAARAHAEAVTRALDGVAGVAVPHVPRDCTHVYYQYCVYGPRHADRDELVVRCVRRGVDVEVLHVDVAPDLDLFAGCAAEAAGAREAARALQVPVYSSLTEAEAGRVAAVVREVFAAA
jgi:dTDP-4-amino-4,6-dideoxygalactose transaminase